MSPRERNMAILLMALILLFGSAAAGYVFVYEPISAQEAVAAKLDEEIRKQQADYNIIKAERKRLAVLKLRSAPPDPEIVRREYIEAMTRILLQAKVAPGFTVHDLSQMDNTGTPLLAPKKPAYSRAQFEIQFDKADMWTVEDFLYGYYQLDLLHQITQIDIQNETRASTVRGRPVSADRKNLKVKIHSEVIILDGATARRSLLAIPTAFAAAEGGLLQTAMNLTPEAGRNITPILYAPVLATRGRDYSLLVQNDIFHGPLPAPPALSFERIRDIAIELGEEIDPIKLALNGDLGPTGKITIEVKADGKPFPPGSYKLNSAGTTLTLNPAKGFSGKSEITLVARTEEGKEAKARFVVNITDPDSQAKAKQLPEISGAIQLTIAVVRADGTGFALIRDNFNPYAYEVEITPSGRVKVVKYWFPGVNRKKDRDYDEPTLLVLSDKVSSTKRTFKVVALDASGLVVEDLKPTEKEKPKGPKKETVAAVGPLALVAGAAAMLVAPAPAAEPILYRWHSGQTLKALKEVPKDEAKRILERSAAAGPVGGFDMAVTEK
ncbi:MAG TPA: hypothetical protein VGI99_12105 [Gemmataceae bacterium]|jgi:hypothetical protein